MDDHKRQRASQTLLEHLPELEFRIVRNRRGFAVMLVIEDGLSERAALELAGHWNEVCTPPGATIAMTGIPA